MLNLCDDCQKDGADKIEELEVSQTKLDNDIVGMLKDISDREDRIKELEDALRKIIEEQGLVCSNYEICKHRACNSSHASWEIASKALEEK